MTNAEGPSDPVSAPVAPRVARRHRRAARDRANALSPVRLLMRLVALPGLALAVAMSVYVRTSPFEPQVAVQHLIARTGCDNARALGLAPARRGAPGYHARLDPDGDGVSCAAARRVNEGVRLQDPERGDGTRYVGGAKFVRP